MDQRWAEKCGQSRRTITARKIVHLLALCLLGLTHTAGANPDAKRLYDDLLSDYNKLIRPVGNNSDKLRVKLGLKLSQLIDVVSHLFTQFLIPENAWAF